MIDMINPADTLVTDDASNEVSGCREDHPMATPEIQALIKAQQEQRIAEFNAAQSTEPEQRIAALEERIASLETVAALLELASGQGQEIKR